jgi:cardiolipin synthase
MLPRGKDLVYLASRSVPRNAIYAVNVNPILSRHLSKNASFTDRVHPRGGGPWSYPSGNCREISTTPTRNMFIQVEDTPNPNSLKFYPGEMVMESGTANFDDKAQGSLKSPLAKALFKIRGVKSVFFAQDFITVSKDDDDKVEWDSLKPKVFSAITEYYAMQQPLLYSSTNEQPRGLRNNISERYDETQDKRKLKIITIPNVLTSSRIILTPAIGYFIWNGMQLHAFSCFIVAALTDLVDGLIARHMNQCSEIGAILDPVADKLLLTTCFVALYHVDLMPIWLVGSFIFRDIALLGGGLLLRYRSFKTRPNLKQFIDFNEYPAPDFQPTMLSKCNTALQCSTIVTHLSGNHLVGSSAYYDLLVTSLHALTATTTLASFGQYLTRAVAKKN